MSQPAVLRRHTANHFIRPTRTITPINQEIR